MSLNSVSISGRLTRDPQIRNFGQRSVGSFTVACDRNFFNRQHKIETDFFDVQTWRSVNFLKYFHQGDGIIVHGQLEDDHYTDRNGNPRSHVRINADQIAAAGRSRNSNGRPTPPRNGGQQFGGGSNQYQSGNVQRPNPMNNGPIPNNSGNNQPQGPNNALQGNSNRPVDPFPQNNNNNGNNKPNNNNNGSPFKGGKKLNISKDDLPF